MNLASVYGLEGGESTAGVPQVALDRPLGLAEVARDLRDRQVAEVMEHDRQSEPVGQGEDQREEHEQLDRQPEERRGGHLLDARGRHEGEQHDGT